MEPNRPLAPRPAPGLLQRLFPPVVAARDAHRGRALMFGAIAVVIVLVGIFAAPDAEGLVLALIIGGVLGAVAGYHVWRLRRTKPQEQIVTRAEGLPVAQRPAALRRAVWTGGLGCLVLSFWAGWELWTVETGRAERATVWAPIAFVYEHLGFWPAMLTAPALGVLIVVSGLRKARAADAEARSAAPTSPQ